MVKSPPDNAGDIRDARSIPVGKTPWRRAWQLTPVFLPGASHGQRSLAATVHGVTESDTTEEAQHTCTKPHDNTMKPRPGSLFQRPAMARLLSWIQIKTYTSNTAIVCI